MIFIQTGIKFVLLIIQYKLCIYIIDCSQFLNSLYPMYQKTSQKLYSKFNSNIIVPIPIECDTQNVIDPVDPLNISFSQQKCIKHTRTPSTQSPNVNSSLKKHNKDPILIQNWQDQRVDQLQKQSRQNYMSVVRNPLQLFGTTQQSCLKHKITELDFSPLSNKILTNQMTKKSLQNSNNLLKNQKKRSPAKIQQQKRYYSLKKTHSDFTKRFPDQNSNYKISLTDKKNIQKLRQKQNLDVLYGIKREQYMNQKYIKLSKIVQSHDQVEFLMRKRLDRYDTSVIDLRMRNLQRLKQELKHQVTPVGKFGSHINEIQRLDTLLCRVNSQLYKSEGLK